MSGKNDDLNGAALAIAFLGAIVVAVAAFIFALAAFVALIFSIFALFALDGGLSIGEFEIEEDEARRFLALGLLGAGIVPFFVLFSSLLIGFRFQDSWWFYLVIGGYCAGCLVVFPAVESELRKAEAEAETKKKTQILPPPPPQAAPPRPFTFADWDDEERL
jgi:hypothetical protein